MKSPKDIIELKAIPILRHFLPQSIHIEKKPDGDVELTMDDGKGQKEQLNLSSIVKRIRSIIGE